MLQRIAFHGQYGIGGLLEASDKDFKVLLPSGLEFMLLTCNSSIVDFVSLETFKGQNMKVTDHLGN